MSYVVLEGRPVVEADDGNHQRDDPNSKDCLHFPNEVKQLRFERWTVLDELFRLPCLAKLFFVVVFDVVSFLC